MAFSDFIVYVDESGDHGLLSVDPAYPLFVLSFCIFRKADYICSAMPRITDLKFRTFGHDQVILHEADLRKKAGGFSKFGKEERESFLEELSSIMEDLTFTIVAVVIRKDHLNSQYHSPDNPYNIAMKYGLERISRFLKREGQSEKITNILFECRGRKEDAELELEFRRVCSGNNATNEPLPLEITFVDKKSNSSGLQIADMTARPIGLMVLRPDQPNRTSSILDQKFYRDTYYQREPVKHGLGLKVFP